MQWKCRLNEEPTVYQVRFRAVAAYQELINNPEAFGALKEQIQQLIKDGILVAVDEAEAKMTLTVRGIQLLTRQLRTG